MLWISKFEQMFSRDQFPAEVLALLGPTSWIQGGALRDLICNKPVKDWDFVEGRAKRQLGDIPEAFESRIKKLGFVLDPNMPNSYDEQVAYVKGDIVIDYNDWEMPSNPFQAIAKFNVTMCQFITNGELVFYTSDAIEHCKEQIIVLCNLDRATDGIQEYVDRLQEKGYIFPEREHILLQSMKDLGY